MMIPRQVRIERVTFRCKACIADRSVRIEDFITNREQKSIWPVTSADAPTTLSSTLRCDLGSNWQLARTKVCCGKYLGERIYANWSASAGIIHGDSARSCMHCGSDGAAP